MALTDPIFKIQIEPRASTIAPIEYIEQADMGGEMKIPLSLVAGSPQIIDLTKVGTLYRIIFLPNFGDGDPVATKLTMKVFKLPSPEKEFTIEFEKMYIWDIPSSWVGALKSLVVTTDSTVSYSVDLRLFGR